MYVYPEISDRSFRSNFSIFPVPFINVIKHSSLYDAHFVTYNVHSLLYLPKYIIIHGCLNNFSCFKYENDLQYIKKSVKSAKYPLQEITNRIIKKQTRFISVDIIIIDPIVVMKEIVNTTLSSYFCSTDKLFENIFYKNYI